MSTEEKVPHIGKKIERIRIIRGIKQETLATALGVTQGAISRMEHTEAIEDEKLAVIASVLGVTVDAIKNFDETAVLGSSNFFNSPTSFKDNAGAIINNFNQADKMEELYKSAIERLERENEKLHKLIEKLTGRL